MDFLSNINLKKSTLTKNELKACEAICEDLYKVQQLSLTEMSLEIDITKTTILRFCQKLGYSGYSEFKYDCIKYVNSLSNSNEEDNIEDDNSRIIRIENIYINTIKLMHHTLDNNKLIELANLIKNSRYVKVIGEINSSVSALQLRYALLMHGIDAQLLNSPAEVKAVDLCINEEDLLIVFSNSAKSATLKEAMALKANNSCKVALVTMNAQSPLEKEVESFTLLPSVASLKNKSLLDGVPIFSIFVEILLRYINY